MEAISREDFLANLNQHLAEINCKPVVSDRDITWRIKTINDPLDAENLRCLVSLWAGLLAYRSRINTAKSPRKPQDIPYITLIRSLANLNEFSYCKSLINPDEERTAAWAYGLIAEAQAKQGLLDEALHSLSLIRTNDTETVLTIFLPQIALEFSKHNHPSNKKLFRKAYHALKLYSDYIFSPNPPHADPIPHAYARLAVALAEAGEYKSALALTQEIDKLTVRATTLAQISVPMREKDPASADILLAEIEQLSKEKKSINESIYSHWQSEILCEYALLHQNLEAKQAILLEALALAQTHNPNPRDSYWIIAESFAKIGDVVNAMQVIERMDDYFKGQLTADLAGLLASINPEASDNLFKKANQLARESIEVSHQASMYRQIATNLAKVGKHDLALQAVDKMLYLDGGKRDPIRAISLKFAEQGQLARALATEFSLEYDHYFFQDLSEYSQAIEKVEAEAWLTILRDCLKIFSWIDPIWLELLKRISN